MSCLVSRRVTRIEGVTREPDADGRHSVPPGRSFRVSQRRAYFGGRPNVAEGACDQDGYE